MNDEKGVITVKFQEKNVGDFYNRWSSELMKRWKAMEETSALHYGFHTLKTKSMKQSFLNMNDYVAKLLNINEVKNQQILDAGCGIGGTSIYFSKMYPNLAFTGITISSHQISMAQELSKKMNISNARFEFYNYLNTGFSDNQFDKIFALESFSYCTNYKKFIDEMYRILKPGGTLAVVDAFRTPRKIGNMMKKTYNCFSTAYGNAVLTRIDEYKKYLNEKGFENILVENITWNVAPSVFLWSFPAISNYVSKKIKVNKSSENSKNNDKNQYDKYGNLFAFIVGACGIIKYYGTSAIKKK